MSSLQKHYRIMIFMHTDMFMQYTMKYVLAKVSVAQLVLAIGSSSFAYTKLNISVAS